MKKLNSSDKVILISSILTIIMTIYMASLSNIFYTNFSYVGNMGNHRLSLILWCTTTSFSFNYILYKLNKLKFAHYLVSFTLLLLPSIIPYLKGYYPVLASLHIIIGYIGFIYFNMCLYQTLFKITITNTNMKIKIIDYYLFIMFIAGIIFMIFGSINGLFEVFYTITINLFLLIVLKKS